MAKKTTASERAYNERKAEALKALKALEQAIKADAYDQSWGYANAGTMSEIKSQIETTLRFATGTED